MGMVAINELAAFTHAFLLAFIRLVASITVAVTSLAAITQGVGSSVHLGSDALLTGLLAWSHVATSGLLACLSELEAVWVGVWGGDV